MYCLAAREGQVWRDHARGERGGLTGTQRRFLVTAALRAGGSAGRRRVGCRSWRWEAGDGRRVGTVCDRGGAILLRVSGRRGLERSLGCRKRGRAGQAGQRLGTLVLSGSSGPLAEIPVLAAESVPRLNRRIPRMLGLLAGLSGGSGERQGIGELVICEKSSIIFPTQ